MGLMLRKPFRAPPVSVAGGLLLAVLWLLPVALVQADRPAPERARDLRYGWVLYNYHQGHAFEALTQLAVAREKGGIQGHGDHPALVEGGLMLSWGMTREANRLFTRLLGADGDGSGLSPEVRNQAWFYLGKVFYLEGDHALALETLERINGDLLAEADNQLFREWIYLRARLAMMSAQPGDNPELESLREPLPDTDIWSLYLLYNSAILALDAGDTSDAESILGRLIALVESKEEAGDPEHQGLLDRARLSLSRLYLRDNRFDQALAVLERMSLHGPFSDQALFDYAVAAAGQGRPERALEALETLSGRQLFLPWRQQVPFARGYILEQMAQPERALSAYELAAEQYRDSIGEVNEIRGRLTEESLMAQLSFSRDSEGLLTDAYGRLRVTPIDSGLSGVLATERFQQALSELNELYGVQSFIVERRSRLDAFRTMLDTRRQQRQIRGAQTRSALEEQQASQWRQRYQAFREAVSDAVAREDAGFFMTSEQKALKAKLDEVEKTLAALPDDESTAAQRATYHRMRAYFDWWVEDEYGVNRWAAQKQVRELEREMARFQAQRQTVGSLLAADTRHRELSRRINAREQDLENLGRDVSMALENARQTLLLQLDQVLAAQQEELKGYLVASRHAQARLADRLFRARQASGAGND